jgi:hypothetical protein
VVITTPHIVRNVIECAAALTTEQVPVTNGSNNHNNNNNSNNNKNNNINTIIASTTETYDKL